MTKADGEVMEELKKRKITFGGLFAKFNKVQSSELTKDDTLLKTNDGVGTETTEDKKVLEDPMAKREHAMGILKKYAKFQNEQLDKKVFYRYS